MNPSDQPVIQPEIVPENKPTLKQRAIAFTSWFKHLSKKQKTSLITFAFLLIAIPIGVVATFYQIRERSKAAPETPSISLPITPPEELINTAIRLVSENHVNLWATNTATFNPNNTGETLEFWFKFDQPENLESSIVNLSGPDRQLSISLVFSQTRVDSSAFIKVVVPQTNDNNKGFILRTTPLQANTWYHIAYTQDTVTKKSVLYLNGQQVDDQTYTGPYNLFESIPHIQIGSTEDLMLSNLPGFTGVLEDFHISSINRYHNNFEPLSFNLAQADAFTLILWKFNHSNKDYSIYNIPWSAIGDYGYVSTSDEPYHSVCNETGQCISIPGTGDDQCQTDFECQVNEETGPLIGVGCTIAGCSSQLCVNEEVGPISTTCEWKEEYSCYRTSDARCEKQDSGDCGWTQTPELLACLGIEQESPPTGPTPPASPIISPRPGTPSPTPKANNEEKTQQEEQANNNSSDEQTSNLCQDQAPTSPADLYQINADSTNATLYFAPAGEPYTHYLIQFGEGNSMQHSTSFEASSATGALTADIHLLKSNTTYTFQILAFNHCAANDWSNQMTIRTTTGTTRTFYKNIPLAVRSNVARILGSFTGNTTAPTTKLTPIETSTQETPSQTETYQQTTTPDYQAPQPSDNFVQRVIKSIAKLFYKE